MSAEFTPEQFNRARQANMLQLAGFNHAAKAIVDGLRKETARPNYGSFRLNEADECAMENVETPRRDRT